jgi:hypothetical protein
MTDLIDLMNGEQKAQYASGEIKLAISDSGSIIATDSNRIGEGRTPRLAIEAMLP